MTTSSRESTFSSSSRETTLDSDRDLGSSDSSSVLRGAFAGRNIRKNPLVPKTWVFGLLLILLCAATLATVAVLSLKGYIHASWAPSWANDVFQAVAWTVTAGASVTAVMFLIHVNRERRLRKEKILMQEKIDASHGRRDVKSSRSEAEETESESETTDTDSSVDAEDSEAKKLQRDAKGKDKVDSLSTSKDRATKKTASTPLNPEPIDYNDYNDVKAKALKTTILGYRKMRPCFYNLNDPKAGFTNGETLPKIKKMDGKGKLRSVPILWGARLPDGFGACGYPKEISEQFSFNKESHKGESYVLILDNRRKASTFNICLHDLAMPSFEPNKQPPRGVSYDSDSNGWQMEMEVCMPKSVGLLQEGTENKPIPLQADPEQFPLTLGDGHRYSLSGTQISVNTQVPVAQGSIYAAFGKKMMAIEVLIVNDASKGSDGEKLLTALEKDTLSETLDELTHQGFSRAAQFGDLFIHPDYA